MNPNAMNPMKFQQLKEKRKLLWSGKKSQTVRFFFLHSILFDVFTPLYHQQSRNQWETVSFGEDDKETAKFRRLMGISKFILCVCVCVCVSGLEYRMNIQMSGDCVFESGNTKVSLILSSVLTNILSELLVSKLYYNIYLLLKVVRVY